ncbi:hypothetical protein D3C72_1602810 [compost metagenome]
MNGYRWFEAVRRLQEALYEEPQPFSQGFGTPDYWVNRLLEELEGLPDAVPIVIDDLRRRNEAEALKREGFMLVRVETPLKVCKERILARDGQWEDAWLTHESEQDLENIPFDLTVPGAGPVEKNAERLLALAAKAVAQGR